MRIKNLTKITISLALCSCASISEIGMQENKFLNSGSIVISKAVPSKNVSEQIATDKNDFEGMNQLLGYFPPTQEFSPAFNETWLEINTKNNTAKLMEGDVAVDKFKVEGLTSSKPGYYFVSAKELEPVWSAPATYFLNRGLSVPENSSRYGAYGDMAIFTSGELVIHSAPIWSNEVGGFKLSQKKLSKVFSSLPLGSQIVVK